MREPVPAPDGRPGRPVRQAAAIAVLYLTIVVGLASVASVLVLRAFLT